MTDHERAMALAAGWREHLEGAETDYVWTKDGVDWYLESEVLVEVLRDELDRVATLYISAMERPR